MAYNFDVRVGSPEGEVIGQGSLPVHPAGTPGAAIVMPITKNVSGKQTLYITGVLYLLLTLLAVWGWRNWRQQLRAAF